MPFACSGGQLQRVWGSQPMKCRFGGCRKRAGGTKTRIRERLSILSTLYFFAPFTASFEPALITGGVPSPTHLSMASLSNLQTLPIRMAGILPSAAYLQIVIWWRLRYLASSFVVGHDKGHLVGQESIPNLLN